MSKTQKSKSAPAKEPAQKTNPDGTTSLQKFRAVIIDRRQIKGAEYNPRIIEESNKKALRNSLQTHGLLEPLVWNETTGTLVSGHQRLSIMDDLEGGEEYRLTVSAVKMDLVQEIEANIALNNTNLMGSFDMNKIAAFDGKIDFGHAGFSKPDVDFFKGLNFQQEYTNKPVEELVDMFENIKQENKAQQTPDEYLERKAKVQDVKTSVNQTTKDPTEYLTVICQSAADRIAILQYLGKSPNTEFILAADIMEIMGLSPEDRGSITGNDEDSETK